MHRSTPSRRHPSRQTSSRPRRVGLLALVVAPLVFVACSKSAATGGEGLIERDLAESIGLGELDATCEEPASREEGETYVCTATTEDGRVIEFLGTVEDDDRINVVTTNLLTLADLDGLRDDAATRFTESEDGPDMAADDIDCGTEPVILDEHEFICEVTDVTTGDVWELIITTTPFEPGVGIRSEFYQIGEQLR